MIRELAKSIREYKKSTVLTPIFVSLEVVMECIIPFMIAALVNKIKNGCDLMVIVKSGIMLIFMAVLSLIFGAMAGARVLRHPVDWLKIFAKICSIISKNILLKILIIF